MTISLLLIVHLLLLLLLLLLYQLKFFELLCQSNPLFNQLEN